MLKKRFITTKNKLTLSILVLVLFALIGCSQKENSSYNTVMEEEQIRFGSNVEKDLESSEKLPEEILSDLANQEFTIEEEKISDAYEPVVIFGKSFVNLYTGAVAEQETVSFENYISNENLLKFINKMLELEQKKELVGGIGVVFGLENEFKEVEFKELDANLCYLSLSFSYQGSGMTCKMLVQSESKSLKLVDFYFGNRDGVDTIATGHHTVRELDNPKIWDDQEWVNGVFDKIKEYEAELLDI